MNGSEGLTHLHGKQLTEKDNPTIVFRGKLDTLCAMILEAQLLGEQTGNQTFADDLQEILEFTRRILPAEYKGTPMGEFHLLGMTSTELQDRCRHPKRHFGYGHLLMDKSMGALCLRLNLLRTFTREAEVSAVTAFRDPSSPTQSFRPDILEALNRLSALFYVLTYKYLPTDYSPQGNAGI